MDTKEKTKKLIEFLESSKDTFALNIFDEIDHNWHFYFSICGFYKKYYFKLFINHHKKSPIDVEIADNTDNPNQIKELLKKFDLFVTN